MAEDKVVRFTITNTAMHDNSVFLQYFFFLQFFFLFVVRKRQDIRGKQCRSEF